PPDQPDWRRITDRPPYDGPDIVRAYAREPNWTDFGPGYVDALSYDFTSIAGYVGAHADRDTVMIVLGDHQPPAAVSGEHASWDVPVHVIASRTAVLDRLVGHGFQRRGDDDRSGRRKLIEITQACEAELPCAVHDRVVRKRRVEGARLARVGADRLDADADDVAIVREHPRRARVESRAVRTVGGRI